MINNYGLNLVKCYTPTNLLCYICRYEKVNDLDIRYCNGAVFLKFALFAGKLY